MKLIKFVVIPIFLFVFSTTIQAQNVKPKFKKLIYVPYNVDLSGKDTIHYIGEYLEINENGQAHYTVIYGGNVAEARDTTYQLPDTLITKLNKIFNGNSKLDSYRIADRQSNGFIYKGRLIFISLTDLKENTHSYIDVKPYMNQEFNAALNATIHRASNITYKNIILDTKVLFSQIMKTQESCKYCAKIEDLSKNPPTVQHLEIASPPARH
jgi:hypothetical protein